MLNLNPIFDENLANGLEFISFNFMSNYNYRGYLQSFFIVINSITNIITINLEEKNQAIIMNVKRSLFMDTIVIDYYFVLV